MRELNSVKECDKCRWSLDLEAWDIVKTLYVGEQPEWDAAGISTGILAVDEHILRTCPRCQYTWKEKCADAKETTQTIRELKRISYAKETTTNAETKTTHT